MKGEGDYDKVFSSHILERKTRRVKVKYDGRMRL